MVVLLVGIKYLLNLVAVPTVRWNVLIKFIPPSPLIYYSIACTLYHVDQRQHILRRRTVLVRIQSPVLYLNYSLNFRIGNRISVCWQHITFLFRVRCSQRQRLRGESKSSYVNQYRARSFHVTSMYYADLSRWYDTLLRYCFLAEWAWSHQY